MRVLIIDDDPAVHRIVSRQLGPRGITVVGVVDPFQALRAVREQRPDVILLDLGLPGGDGFLMLERLKANTLLSTIPVIIVTARDLKEVEGKAVQAGAAASLQKPIHMNSLLAVMEQVLKDLHQTGGPQLI